MMLQHPFYPIMTFGFIIHTHFSWLVWLVVAVSGIVAVGLTTKDKQGSACLHPTSKTTHPPGRQRLQARNVLFELDRCWAMTTNIVLLFLASY